MASAQASAQTNTTTLFRYLQDYHRITIDDACRERFFGNANDIGIWVNQRGTWKLLDNQTKKLAFLKYNRKDSVCKFIITTLFGLSGAQYQKIRASFEEKGWKSWSGVYRANFTDQKPPFVIVIKLPDDSKMLAGGVGGAAGLVVGATLGFLKGKTWHQTSQNIDNSRNDEVMRNSVSEAKETAEEPSRGVNNPLANLKLNLEANAEANPNALRPDDKVVDPQALGTHAELRDVKPENTRLRLELQTIGEQLMTSRTDTQRLRDELDLKTREINGLSDRIESWKTVLSEPPLFEGGERRNFHLLIAERNLALRDAPTAEDKNIIVREFDANLDQHDLLQDYWLNYAPRSDMEVMKSYFYNFIVASMRSVEKTKGLNSKIDLVYNGAKKQFDDLFQRHEEIGTKEQKEAMFDSIAQTYIKNLFIANRDRERKRTWATRATG